MSYRLTVRRGPQVTHEDWDTLEAAIAAAARHAKQAPGRGTVDLVARRYEPRDQVAARIELKHRNRRAGLDVRGDGALIVWSGRVRRQQLTGDDPFVALKDALTG